MRKFGQNIFFFILVTPVIYILFVFAISFLPGSMRKNLIYPIGERGFMFSRIKEVKTTKDIDILFLGSSHTYRGFDPRIFADKGYSSFNLGSSSQTPIQTKILLHRYLDQLNPKIIILEVAPSILESDGVESALDLISSDFIDWDIIKMVVDLKNVKVLNTLILGILRKVLKMDLKYIEPLEKENELYVRGGYSQTKFVNNRDNLVFKKQNWHLLEKQKKELIELVEYIKSKNIRLILVQAPITTTCYNSFLNNNENDKFYSDLGEFYNFNGEVELDDSLDFFDYQHLTQTGVEKFNRKLLRTIELK